VLEPACSWSGIGWMLCGFLENCKTGGENAAKMAAWAFGDGEAYRVAPFTLKECKVDGC
jgi:hypothetical protein